MSVSISGILLDPFGQPASFAEVKFITWQGANDVLTTAPAVFKTSADGAYSFAVEFATYTVQVRYNQSNGKFQTIKQKVIVNSTTVADTLGELLLFNEPLTPPEIAYVEQLVAEAEGYRDDAATSAAASEASSQASEGFSQASATSAAESAQSAIDAANSAALIVPVTLNGGVWAGGQTYTAYNEYMIYNGEAYSPLPATVLPYTVGATPDLGFVYQIKLNDHSLLANRNDAGAHSPTATGSTTPRTLEDRFADVVNVKDFGAIGDGIADDTVAFRDAIISADVAKAYIYIGEGYTYAIDDLVTTASSIRFKGKSTLKRLDDQGGTRVSDYMMEITGVNQLDLGDITFDFNKDNAYLKEDYQVFGETSFCVRIVPSTDNDGEGNATPDKWVKWNSGGVRHAARSGVQVISDDQTAGFHSIDLGDLYLYDACQQFGVAIRGQHEYIRGGNIVVEDPLGRLLDVVDGVGVGAKALSITSEAYSTYRPRYFYASSISARWVGSAVFFIQNVDVVEVGAYNVREALKTSSGAPTVNSAVTLCKIDHALGTIPTRYVHIGVITCRDSYNENPNVGFKTCFWLDEGDLKDCKIESVNSDMSVNMAGSTTYGNMSYRNNIDTATMYYPAFLGLSEGCNVNRLELVGGDSVSDVVTLNLGQTAKVWALNTSGFCAVSLIGSTDESLVGSVITNATLSDDTTIRFSREDGDGVYLDCKLDNVQGGRLLLYATEGNIYKGTYEDWAGFVKIKITGSTIYPGDSATYALLSGTTYLLRPDLYLRDTILYTINDDHTSPLQPVFVQQDEIMLWVTNGNVGMNYTNPIVDVTGTYVTGFLGVHIGTVIRVIAGVGASLVHSANLINKSGSTISGSDGLFLLYLVTSNGVAQQI